MVVSKIAFVFPGQGSQSIGMLADLAAEYPIILDTYAQASQALDYDLWELVQAGPEEKLNQTQYAQPALLAAGVAVWRSWVEQGGRKPNFLAGHSLGEYTALVCGEALGFADAVRLVAERGRLMQEAVPIGKGAMAAIVGLSDDKIPIICQEAAQSQILAAANYNSMGQIVLAGEIDAVQRAVVVAKNMGAKIAKVLPVSVPSHCALMIPAAEKLSVKLQKIKLHSPQIPVIHNADVCSYTQPDDIRSALVRQLYSPVRWVETVLHLVQQDVKKIIECGPGKVLTGLNKRIVSEVECEALGVAEGLKKQLLIMNNGVTM